MGLSPMMQQYMQTKEKYKNALLFYRLGDFYEMFFDDAVIASRVLELTLTGRDCGLEERAPMCGVPYHAVDTYIAKLIQAGYSVAICEQLTEPTKGKMVERDVVRVITPGTVMENNILEEKKNNFIAALCYRQGGFGIAFCDISTGETYANQYEGEEYFTKLNDILVTMKPSEILANEKAKEIEKDLPIIKLQAIPAFSYGFDDYFDFDKAYASLKTQYSSQLKGSGITDKKDIIMAFGTLLQYLFDTQKRSLNHLKPIEILHNEEYVNLDMNTRRNLELLENSKDHKKHGSLLWLLDKTQTAMGGRCLRSWVDRPLYNYTLIQRRLQAVKELVNNVYARQTMTEILRSVYDIERLVGKVSYGSINPRDCEALGKSLSNLPKIKEYLAGFKSTLLKNIYENIFNFDDITSMLTSAIVDNPPMVLKEGGFIRKGYNAQMDKLTELAENGVKLIVALESKEKEETGIKNLKIAYNKVFGYYVEIPKSQQDLVPYRYVRKQTTVNSERYIFEELKVLEDNMLHAKEDKLQLELELFNQIKDVLKQNITPLQTTAKNIAMLDALLSLANVAVERNYVMPKVEEKSKVIEIIDGRHPVVEALSKEEQFVPNDTHLDDGDNRTMIITGPNMAGKSTYMRQVALITLMAHIGSFVPAKSATICLTDRIFTRIGASDDLAAGQSTFMVEMVEVSNIIKNATNNSLIILDEVGRGTSTFDGLSIAQSVMEYLATHLRAKTLFATHYHELTELEGKLEGVKNYKVSVKEYNNSIIFLRKIVRGGANRSFGTEVAGLAGLPKELLDRSREILHELEEKSLLNFADKQAKDTQLQQAKDEKLANQLLLQIKDIDINSLTPLGAFEIVCDLVQKTK